MSADDFKRESDVAPPTQPTGCGGCGRVCNGTLIIDSNARCFTNKSKWFDSNAESATLSRSYSTASATTLVDGGSSDAGRYWVCSLCRRATTDPKRSIGRINNTTFPCCTPCATQFRMQRIFGMIFRMIQIHLCFSMLWIPSPTGVFLGDKHRNHTEWAIAVTLLVVTIFLQFVSFFNALLFRPLALMRRKQVKHPWLDFWLEAMCVKGWAALIGIMAYDGAHQYAHGRWNGALIALIICGVIMMISYMFTAAVAWSILTNTTTTVIQGFPDPLGQKPKISIVRAIAYLS